MRGHGHAARRSRAVCPPSSPAPDWPVVVRPGADSHLAIVPFRLSRTARLTVQVTGEADERDGAALDFGWIEDARTGRTVWSAEDASPQPAGNAAVNVKWEGSLALNAGDYLAGFLSDAVHGPGDWHELPPYDPEAWGLRLTPVAADAGALAVTARGRRRRPRAGTAGPAGAPRERRRAARGIRADPRRPACR